MFSLLPIVVFVLMALRESCCLISVTVRVVVVLLVCHHYPSLLSSIIIIILPTTPTIIIISLSSSLPHPSVNTLNVLSLDWSIHLLGGLRVDQITNSLFIYLFIVLVLFWFCLPLLF